MHGNHPMSVGQWVQVLFLALRMPLDGIVPQIMSLPPHMLETKPEDLAAAPGVCSILHAVPPPLRC